MQAVGAGWRRRDRRGDGERPRRVRRLRAKIICRTVGASPAGGARVRRTCPGPAPSLTPRCPGAGRTGASFPFAPAPARVDAGRPGRLLVAGAVSKDGRGQAPARPSRSACDVCAVSSRAGSLRSAPGIWRRGSEYSLCGFQLVASWVRVPEQERARSKSRRRDGAETGETREGDRDETARAPHFSRIRSRSDSGEHRRSSVNDVGSCSSGRAGEPRHCPDTGP